MSDYVQMFLGPKRILVPSEWQQKKFSSVVMINPSYDVPERKEYAYVPMDSVEEGTGRIRYWQRREESELTNTCFTIGDILFAKITPSLENGKVAYVDALPKGHKFAFGSTELIVFSPKNGQIDSHFLYYMTSADLFRAVAVSMMQGSTNRQRVPLSIFRRGLSVPVPSFSEQKCITEILSTVDEAIRKTDEVIKAATRLKRGLMQEILTRGIGHTKFKEVQIGPRMMKIPISWHVIKLSKIAGINMGQSPPGSSYNNEGNGIPFFQGNADFGDFHPVESNWTTEPKKIAELGDILISVRAPVGEINVADMNCCIGRGLAAVRAKKETDETFLYYQLSRLSRYLESYSQGSTFESVNKDVLVNFDIPIPVFSEQKRIAEILSAIDENLQKEKKYKDTLEKLKKGLMQDLLTGKVRVKTDGS